MHRDIVIVGGGPAGLTAAELLAQQGLAVGLVHKGPLGGELPSLLWVDGVPEADAPINGAELASQLIDRAQAAGVTFISREATALELYSRSAVVALSGHGFVQGSAVVLAMGRRRILGEGFHKFEGRGLIGCTACDAGFYRGETVVVCGAGHGGAIDAINLAAHAERVILVERANELGCSPELAEQLHRNAVIEIMLSSEVSGANATASGAIDAVHVNTKDAGPRTLPATGLSIQVGRTPETEFLDSGVGLDSEGLIETDECCRIPASRIFAIGEVRAGSARTFASAIADARAAAQAILSNFAGIA